MPIVTQTWPFVIGVDTHARTHTLAVLTNTGALVDTRTFPNTHTGHTRAISWAARRTSNQPVLWVIEGAASYGATLARAVTAAGHRVVEAARMNPKDRRGKGKSDPLDAHRIATAVLGLNTDQLRVPRQDDGVRAAIQILLTARETLTGERTRAINALTALLRLHDLGVDARRPIGKPTITLVASWRTRTEPLATTVARTEATRLAKRITDLGTELKTNHTNLTDLVKQTRAAGLLNQTGYGTVTTATAYVAWSHPGRVRDEAAYASLAGVNPIPASSGNTNRHRLNRGGDRRLNRALHTITITRMTHDPQTRQYIQKRQTEGRTTREIRRSLKRYIARHIYRHLNTTHQLDET